MKFELEPRNATFHTEPFSHSTYSKFFTDETYSLLLKNIPAKEKFTRVAYAYDLNSKERFEIWPTHKKDPSALATTFWDELERFFYKDEVISHLFEPLNETIQNDPALRDLLGEGRPIPRVRLVSERCPFNLPPHLDMPCKLLVAVVYLNESGGSENNGTTLYKKNIDGTFTYIKNTPYKENTAVAMPRTLNSWHGGTWTGGAYRTTLHIYYYNANYFKNLKKRKLAGGSL